jgi:hypothetical protein
VGSNTDHSCEDWTDGFLWLAYGPYSDFSHADLTGADLRYAMMEYAKFVNARLAGTNLVGVQFRGADLSGAVLTDANLTGADLSGADFEGAVGLDQAIGAPYYDACTEFGATGFDPVAAGWVAAPQAEMLMVCHAQRMISCSKGGTQLMHVDAGPEHAGRLYWVLGSGSGTRPGISSVPPVPLNPDAYMQFTYAHPNSLILGGLGLLDEQGRAVASISLAPGELAPSFAGVALNHACLVVDAKLGFVDASNATELFL